MTAKSFKQMVKDGEVKRADAMKVRLEDIHVEPGFNLRDKYAVDPETGLTFEEAIAALAEYLAGGGMVPPLEVRPREEGGVWIVEGECRTLAWRKLDAEGRLVRTPSKEDPEVMEFWISVTQFVGNDVERLARVFTSNKNRRLGDLEKAEGCKRFAAFGLTPDQIAKQVGITRQRVDQLLILAGANSDVQQMIRTGEVSGAVATDIVRKHGEDAGKVLGAELEKAKAAGKSKVTAGTIGGPKVPRPLLDDLHTSVTRLHGALTSDDRLLIERFHRGEVTEGTVNVSVEALMHLHLILEESSRIIEEKQAKAREKADKARQVSIELSKVNAGNGDYDREKMEFVK